MSISARLTAAVKSTGADLKSLAAEIGIPYRTLQDYVRGVRKPGADAIETLCTRLRISADWLLLGEGEMRRGEVRAPETRVADAALAGGGGYTVKETFGEDAAARAPPARRIEALHELLEQLDPETRDAILSDAFARAATAQQLADLRQALAELQTERNTNSR